MRNRFDNREVLCAGMDGLTPRVGATGGMRASANVSSSGPTGAEAASSINTIVEGFSTGVEISKSGNVLGSLRSLGIVQS